MQKALLQMNLQLPQVVSDIAGDTGMRIIGATLGGERDPKVLAQNRDRRCKKDEATLAKALPGTWRKEHLLCLKQAHTLYETCPELLVEVEREIVESVKARFPEREEPPQALWRIGRSNKGSGNFPISSAKPRAWACNGCP